MSDKMDKVFDADELYEAYHRARKNVNWKDSVKRYGLNILVNVHDTRESYYNGSYVPKNCVEFTLSERGKIRNIKAVNIHDRIPFNSYCNNILIKELRSKLIYDNCASLKDKGISMQRDRLKVHLQKYFRDNGSNEGYILLMDFSKYFDNLEHEKVVREISKVITDEDCLNFLKVILKQFEIDVSFMSDEEIEKSKNKIFNALKYSKIDKNLLTGEKFIKKSIGIGNEASQIIGVYHPTKLDNYVKIVRGCKYYGRYMDDSYIIHQDKKFLEDILEEIDRICRELGIFLNRKKTRIVKLSSTFRFLKIRYNLTDTGKVYMKLGREYFTRERVKLKKFRTMVDEGILPYKAVENQYRAWRGNVKKYNNYKSLMNMDNLYNELFIEPFILGKE